MDFTWLRRPPVGERLRAAHLRTDLVEAADRAAFGRSCDTELAAVAALLTDDETVEQVLDGRQGKANSLLTLTTGRLLLVTGTAATLIVTRDDVQAASSQTHRGLGALTVTTTSGDLVLDQILGTQAETLAATLTRHPAETPTPPDPLTELAELRARHQAGTIGDDEFQTRKRRLIDEI